MKKMLSNIKTLAALLMAGAAFTACSSDNDITAEQPVQSTEPQVYTMVIKASKGSDAMTRALRPGTNSETGKNTVDSYWSGEETIDVVQDQGGYKIIGTATAAASEIGETTITATLTTAPVAGEDIYFYLHGAINDYTGQVGLLTGTNSISEKYDYAVGNIASRNLTVSGNDISTDATIKFEAVQSIVKFTLKDKGNSDAAINATKLYIHCSQGLFAIYNCLTDEAIEGDITITPDGTTNEIYASMYSYEAKNMTLTANDGNAIYSYTQNTLPDFELGHYYDIKVKMNKILARISGGNASDVLAGGYKSITADEAATLAKQCWTVAGGNVYVVYSASGSIMSPNVSYAYTTDGTTTSTGSATTTMQLAALYGEGNTAWFVEPASLQSVTVTDPNNYIDGNPKTIYYIEGETWRQAIENHPTLNSGWCFYSQEGYNDYYPTFTGYKDYATVYDENGNYGYGFVKDNDVIYGTHTYRFEP